MKCENAHQFKAPAVCSTHVSFSMYGDNESDQFMSSGNEQSNQDLLIGTNIYKWNNYVSTCTMHITEMMNSKRETKFKETVIMKQIVNCRKRSCMKTSDGDIIV